MCSNKSIELQYLFYINKVHYEVLLLYNSMWVIIETL